VIESSALFIEHDSRRQSNGDKVDGWQEARDIAGAKQRIWLVF
jgi:hypothetical protein